MSVLTKSTLVTYVCEWYKTTVGSTNMPLKTTSLMIGCKSRLSEAMDLEILSDDNDIKATRRKTSFAWAPFIVVFEVHKTVNNKFSS